MRTLRQRTKSTSLVMSPAASSLVVKNGLRPLTLPLTMTGDRSALPQQPTCLTKLLLRAQSPKAFVSSASVATRFGVAVVAGAAVAVASRPQFGVSGSATGPVFPRGGTCLQQDRGINHGRDARRSLTSEYLGSRPSPELKSGEEMLNCRRSATSIRARYVQWAG